jgi:uncharacterized protein (DUF983 family)
VCGGGGLFDGWFRMRATCPACGVTFEREPGFFAGALFVNLAFTEILMFLWLAGVLFATIPHPRVAPLVAGAVAICLTVPIAAYPFAKTVWFAIHVAMQPLDPREEAARAAVRFERGDHEFIVDSSGPSRPPG